MDKTLRKRLCYCQELWVDANEEEGDNQSDICQEQVREWKSGHEPMRNTVYLFRSLSVLFLISFSGCEVAWLCMEQQEGITELFFSIKLLPASNHL